MKKVVIVGAGTAGCIAAAMIKKWYEDSVEVEVYYDANNKSIGVGESAAPGLVQFFDEYMHMSLEDLLKKSSTTLKLGINFKNWIPDTEFFHGLDDLDEDHYVAMSSAVYGLLNDNYNGGVNFNNPGTKIQSDRFFGDDDDYFPGVHIDHQEFVDMVMDYWKTEVKFIDDVVENVNIENNYIKSIECKNSGKIEADCFIDCSGFKRILFKNLNPKWIDTSDIFPLDRAIPCNITNNSNEIISYTLAEATDNGWIWVIPVGNEYRTGYLYSSKFTSDKEAREKFNSWTLENYNQELTTDRIIKYNPGYYEDYYIGNCLAVGLSSGFIEPIEATGLQYILNQLEAFLEQNACFNHLEHDRKSINKKNRSDWEIVVNFDALHYATNRTDSDFWKYVTENKIQFVKDLEEKCKTEFLDISDDDEIYENWQGDSWVQIAKGLNMFNKESIEKFIDFKPHSFKLLLGTRPSYPQENRNRRFFVDKKEILKQLKKDYVRMERSKKKYNNWISHKEYLDSLRDAGINS